MENFRFACLIYCFFWRSRYRRWILWSLVMLPPVVVSPHYKMEVFPIILKSTLAYDVIG